jgi:outer membrane protein OmpA-like peptidoglycan-associated protein
MKYQLLTLSAGLALVLVTGCAAIKPQDTASAPPHDINRMRTLVNQAGSGPDGACFSAIHEAAVSLEEARAILAKADTEGLSDAEYNQGLAAAENSIKARSVMVSRCTTRLLAVARQTGRTQAEILGAQKKMQKEIVGTQVGVLQTQQALAKLYERTERLPGVTFESNSAKLEEDAKPILNAIADRLVKESERLEIAGHTSSTGSAEHNMTLSQARADAVRDYFISRGVTASNLTAKGYGMDQPIASNDTQEGRNANKRVEIRYLK